MYVFEDHLHISSFKKLTRNLSCRFASTVIVFELKDPSFDWLFTSLYYITSWMVQTRPLLSRKGAQTVSIGVSGTWALAAWYWNGTGAWLLSADPKENGRLGNN
jgi:hypothetical protein